MSKEDDDDDTSFRHSSVCIYVCAYLGAFEGTEQEREQRFVELVGTARDISGVR